MAANYKVNIQLDTKTLDKQLRDLGVKVDKVGKVKQGQGKKQLSEAEALRAAPRARCCARARP